MFTCFIFSIAIRCASAVKIRAMFCVFIYLFAYSFNLFDFAISSSDYIATNGRMISE
jgi:hypothetical protein